MIRLRALMATSAGALLVASQVFAQSSPPLTAEVVEAFVGSVPEIRQVGEKYDATPLVEPSGSMGDAMKQATAPFTAAVAQMRTHQAHEELLAIVQRRGFADLEQWAQTGDRVMRAFVAAKMDAEAPRMNDQMKQALEQLERSGMPASQKEQMRQMMMSSQQMMGALNDVPAADKAAVTPFIPMIDALDRQ